MSLSGYRKKRRFTKTPEPRGGASTGAVRHFVVQKHQASHLHYDVRLEFGDVLKSWAVPKGPSMDPADKRLAMHVEDHPLAYRTFEGVIPSGNYGAGTVEIWDEGTFTVPGITSIGEMEATLRRAYQKGELTFNLHGKKLHGTFTLVRTPHAKAKNAWLLFKRHDAKTSPEPARLRDPMPQNLRPMLARVSDQPFSREGWVFEMKWDGYRALAEIHRGRVALVSRERKSFNEKYPEIVAALRSIQADVILDGEIVVLDAKGKPNFQFLQDYGLTKQGVLMYMVFDVLYLDCEDLRDVPLRERKQRLKAFLPELERIKISEHIERDGEALFRSAVAAGVEGVMAKRADSSYLAGTRSDDWLKMKAIHRQEAVIGGYTEPRGSRKHVGALVLGVYRNGALEYIGHTGGGSDEKTLEALHVALKKRERSSSPFVQVPKPNAPVHWVKPELVCEVKFLEWTKDGLMRQPILLGLRDDKPATGVVKETATEPALDGIGFSHADKIFWPKEKYTKGDLRDYYLAVAPTILTHLKDRPMSLHRYPDGIEGADFFQKDVPDPPRGIRAVRIPSESQSKSINYLLCNDEIALTYLVQLGCIEMNPWTARIDDLDHPDYLILDLDPEDIPFTAVVQTARVVKDVLDQAGAPGFCKTSGGRGLHVYVPLGRKYTHEQARLFGELVAHLVHHKLPAITSLERNPSKRQHKVYVDYPQNRRGATTVAAYSVRPVPGACVSTPLKWSEVRSTLNLRRFTIKAVPSRIKKLGDLWLPVLGEGIDLEACLQRLS